MSKRKAETLGMPHGTANARLKKAIMFKYIIMAGDNFCFKCGAEIETVDDLSVEHKLPWEGVSSELFFDLDNIAFSHLRCNRPERSGPERTAIVGDTLKCVDCKQYKPFSEFNKNASLWTGYQKMCIPCKKIRNMSRCPRR